MSPLLLHGIALLFYAAAAVNFSANLLLRKAEMERLPRLLLVIGVLAHTTAIGAFCVTVRQSPFASAFGTLSIAAWAIALLSLPLEFWKPAPSLGTLAMPVCCLMLFMGLLRAQPLPTNSPELRSSIISLHVLLILFSFALFALAACCAVFYVWQYRLLKRPHRGGLFRRLPSLEALDSLAYHLVAFALPMLTIGIVLGIARASGLPVHWLSDAKTIVSFMAWLVYGIYLLARTAAGWRGARLQYLLIVGLLVTVALYFIPSATHRFL